MIRNKHNPEWNALRCMMMAMFAALSLVACQRSDTPNSDGAAELQQAREEIGRLEQENAKLLAEKQKAKSKPKPKPEPEIGESEATAYLDEEPESEATALPTKRNLCWQDYCPCDSPETALDTIICRNARGGVAMTDEQWATGAQARDMKRSGDAANREMDQILSDMKARRY